MPKTITHYDWSKTEFDKHLGTICKKSNQKGSMNMLDFYIQWVLM